AGFVRRPKAPRERSLPIQHLDAPPGRAEARRGPGGVELAARMRAVAGRQRALRDAGAERAPQPVEIGLAVPDLAVLGPAGAVVEPVEAARPAVRGDGLRDLRMEVAVDR